MDYFKYIFGKIVCKNGGLCALTLVMILGFSTMQLYLPVLIQQYIDRLTGEPAAGGLFKLAGIYLAVSMGIYVTGILKDWGAAKIAWKGTDFLRLEIVEKILTYDQGFFQKNAPGQVVESLENDLNEIESFTVDTLIPLFVNLLYMVGILVVFWNTNRGVALLFGVFILVALCTIGAQQRKDSDIILRERKSHSDLIGFEGEMITNKKETELAAKENRLLARLEEKILRRIPLKVELQNYYYRVWIVTLSLLAGANVLSLLVGGMLYGKGVISLGVVYLLYSYGNMLKQPFEELQMHIQNFLAAKGSSEKLADLLFYQNDVSEGKRTLCKPFSELELRNISFWYGENQILNDVNMKIKRGEKIGIFGKSGAGKSTVSKLITKALEPQQGEILINGRDIREYSCESVTSVFAYVTAENLVFDADLRENLRLYNGKISDEFLLEMLEGQGLAEFLPFTGGRRGRELLELKIGRQMLSNGEAQLLNLCRLFFTCAPEKGMSGKYLRTGNELIIFDEASAVVDEEVELAFYQIFGKLTEHVTTVIITHHVERLTDCEAVYVMEKGRVIESGRICDLKEAPDSLFRTYTERSWGTCGKE
ncbi:ABC transporter ATP-binding protein [Roseburia hominis]